MCCGCRLLSSFQSSLSEITVIALPDLGPGGSSTNNVKIKSYVDPSKGALLLVATKDHNLLHHLSI